MAFGPELVESPPKDYFLILRVLDNPGTMILENLIKQISRTSSDILSFDFFS